MLELLEFQKKITAIKKDGKNPHFKSTYATLPQILSEVKPILSDLSLVLIQPIKDNKVGSIITNGKESVESWLELPNGLNPQQIGSAITYYRRYTLASLLSLEIDDDDANLASQPTNKSDDSAPDERPWINDKQVQQAIDKIKAGEKGVYEECDKIFRMSKVNREKIKNAA